MLYFRLWHVWGQILTRRIHSLDHSPDLPGKGIRYGINSHEYPYMAGFSLIELLVVLVIIVAGAAIASGPLLDRTGQARIEQTMAAMEEIRDAVLGRPLPGEPALRDVGYLPDMGCLPPLTDGQPKGLWTADTDNDGSDDLLRRSLFIDEGHVAKGMGIDDACLHIRMGWRGPYISVPRDGVLRDGWGNKLIFKNDEPDTGDMTIISPGANGIVSENDGHADADIKLVIYESGCMAPVAGMIIPSGINDASTLENVSVRIYYAAPAPDAGRKNITDLVFMVPDIQAGNAVITQGGYFLFRQVPAGPDRLLEISQPLPGNFGKKVRTYIRFEVMPAFNFLGRIDMRNSYDVY